MTGDPTWNESDEEWDETTVTLTLADIEPARAELYEYAEQVCDDPPETWLPFISRAIAAIDRREEALRADGDR